MTCENCQALLRSNTDLVDCVLDAAEELLRFGAKEEQLLALQKRVRELGEHLRTRPIFPSSLLSKFDDILSPEAFDG